MKYLLVFLVLFFTACSSKNQIDINKNSKTLSIQKEVYVKKIPASKISPVTIGLGIGGLISKHVGINVNTRFRPTIDNSESLEVENNLQKHKIFLGKLVRTSFIEILKNDELYKNRLVSFNSDYKIYLSVLDYSLSSSLLSQNVEAKIEIKIKILDRNDNLVYETIEVSKTDKKHQIHSKEEILYSKELLETAFIKAIKSSLNKIVRKLKG